MYASQKRSTLISGILHAAVIGLVLVTTAVKTRLVIPAHVVLYEPVEIQRYQMPHASDGGGGGGVRSDTPASRGILPKIARRPFATPMVKVENSNPMLAMEPAIQGAEDAPVIDLKLPFGDPNGVLGPASGGQGDGGGIGQGHGKGVGDRKGDGYGDKDGSGVQAARRYASDATAPVLLAKVEPEYSDEARKARLQGEVVLRIDVDTRGSAQNIALVQSLGLGLDERAIAAVARWKFRPGYSGGRPVVTSAIVHVTFRLL